MSNFEPVIGDYFDKTFPVKTSNRPLSKVERYNLDKLIALLITVPDERYDHRATEHSDGTPACALGWAHANTHLFRKELEYRNWYQRLVGRTYRSVREDDYKYQLFGEGMYSYVFMAFAFTSFGDNIMAADVTKNMVLARLMKVRADGVVPFPK